MGTTTQKASTRTSGDGLGAECTTQTEKLKWRKQWHTFRRLSSSKAICVHNYTLATSMLINLLERQPSITAFPEKLQMILNITNNSTHRFQRGLFVSTNG